MEKLESKTKNNKELLLHNNEFLSQKHLLIFLTIKFVDNYEKLYNIYILFLSRGNRNWDVFSIFLKSHTKQHNKELSINLPFER